MSIIKIKLLLNKYVRHFVPVKLYAVVGKLTFKNLNRLGALIYYQYVKKILLKLIMPPQTSIIMKHLYEQVSQILKMDKSTQVLVIADFSSNVGG